MLTVFQVLNNTGSVALLEFSFYWENTQQAFKQTNSISESDNFCTKKKQQDNGEDELMCKYLSQEAQEMPVRGTDV